MAILFDSVKQGSGSNSASIWIDLGVIPAGYKIRIGSWVVYGAKSETFNIYANTAGKSTSGTSNCTRLAYITIKAGATVTQDLYKRGSLDTSSILSTGAEHWWLNIVSKSSTLANYNYKINYTVV